MTRSASIRKRQRKSGVRYEARWWEADPVTGEKRVVGKTFHTEEEAKGHLDDVRYAKRHGTHATMRRQRTEFRVVAEEWLRSRERKPRTVKVYRHMLDTWLAPWMRRPIGTITYSDVAAVMTAMRDTGRRPQTIRNVFNVAHGILSEAVDAGYISVNPAARYRRRLPPRSTDIERRPFTPAEVSALAASMDETFGLLVRLAAWSGLRAGELGGLRVGRFDPLRHHVQVVETVVRLRGGNVPGTPKSRNSHRVVPIPATLSRELSDHVAARGLGPDDYLFGEPDGSPLRHEYFYRRCFRPSLVTIGRTDATFHTLRHTYATLMAPQITMYELSRRMGHASYAMTADVYSHLYECENAEQAAALDAAYASSLGYSSSTGEVVHFPQ